MKKIENVRRPLLIHSDDGIFWYCPRCYKLLGQQSFMRKLPQECDSCKQRINWTGTIATDAENFDVRR